MAAIATAGSSRLERVENTKDIVAGAGGNVSVSCPAGKRVLGIAADWITSVAPTSTWINPSLSRGLAYATNTADSTKTLRVTATCAVVS